MLKYFIYKDNLIEISDWKELIESYSPVYLQEVMNERHYTGAVSVTMCQRCPREVVFKQLFPYAIDPDDMAFAFLGTRVHKRLEVASNLEYGMSERKLRIEMNVPMTGISDYIFDHGSKRLLLDYKTWGSYRIAKALGLEKKQRPMLDAKGNPVLYKRAAGGAKKGDPRTETYYDVNPDKVDLEDVKLQENMYRIMIDKEFPERQVTDMKVYAIVRDGGLQVATSRGVFYKTYAFNVPFVPNMEVIGYHQDRGMYIKENMDRLWDLSLKDILKDPPRAGFPDETYHGFLCKKCPVSHYCSMCADHPSDAENPGLFDETARRTVWQNM